MTYDVADSSGNPASGFRTVDVVDTTVPVITLVGANPQTIEVGTVYTELGATALDNYDGDISGSIVVDSSAVNTAVVGSYSVTYDVTDSEGNPAVQVLRTVDVVDTTVPVITLVGANPQTIEVGTAYSELGATALDNYDGDITGSIVIDASAVNTAVVGSYGVTYDVTDSQGNPAVQVTRTVDVVDTTVPVITLVGANPQTIEVGTAYSELGATASDNYDGDISGLIVIDASAVDTGVIGGYSVTYNVTDSQGNPAAVATRTVNVVDTTPPVITLVGANPQTIEVGSGYVELGATASDNIDGDISGSIVIDTVGVNTSTVGAYAVTYNVTDSQGNDAVEVTRTVNVVDTVAPVITLAGANPQIIEVHDPYVELGAMAIDSYDGNISGSIVIDAISVDTSLIGSYAVTYDVTDAAGNPAVQVTRTVNIVDTTAPVITLVGANPQSIEVGDGYSELGATAVDNLDGDISGLIVIVASAVNPGAVGSYPVTYNVTDATGNVATEVIRTVNVTDTGSPVITLVGPNPQVVEVLAPYVEAGATAFDIGDGDISGSVVIDATGVDTSVVGSYSVTYNVVDSSGNPAIEVTRTVDVVDTTVPVIALNGANPQVIEVGSGYSELGATASDNYDGDITGLIVVDSSSVVPGVVGSYSVTYNVSDAAGNAAAQVTRTVDVVDTTVPVITLLGADPQTIEVGAAYTELGAAALDSYDGDISGAIVIDASGVVPGTIGSYSVTYDVTDSSGNAAVQVTRVVDVVDSTAPVLALVGANPQVIEVGGSYVEAGATAIDAHDGDISGSIVIDASAVNTTTVGSYAVTYDVVDSSGNPAFGVRTVNVVDTTIPIITLVGANPQSVEAGSAYAELGATAFDAYDGDISGSIVIDASAVNTSTVGTYLVTYDVSDAAGNPAVQVTRTVNVVDSVPPVIALIGADPQLVNVGDTYTELGATASDNYDGDISGSVVVDASAVNTTTAGSYPVTYDVTDAAGNPASQVVRTVTVMNVAPTIGGVTDRAAPEGTFVTFTATATDPDPADVLAFSLTGAPSGAAIDPVSGVFTWTPTETQGPGLFTFDVVVTDSGTPAMTDQQSMTVTVSEVNLAPSLGAIGPQIVDELSVLTFNATGSDSDVPANTLTYSLVGAPATATVNPTTGLFSWTPTEIDGPGAFAFDVVVVDNGNPSLNATQPVTVTVAEANSPPVVANPGNQSGAEADVVALAISVTDVDLPANTVGYSATGLPDGLAIDAVTGLISGTVGYDAAAASPFTTVVTATDSGSPAMIGQTTFTWTVMDTNRAPFANADAITILEDEGRVVFVLTNDSDPDGDPLSIASIGIPAHGTTTGNAGGISYVPDLNYFGPDSFTYTISDGRGGTDSATVTVTVTSVNDAPMLTAPSLLDVDEGDAVTFKVSTTDVEGDAVSFSLAAAPAGASIDPASGTFRWTPTEFQGPGSYFFDIIATDSGSPARSAAQRIQINVAEVNVAPIVVNPGSQVSSENQAVNLQVSASDADIPAGSLTYSATGLPPGLSIDPDSGAITGTTPFDASIGSPYSVTVTVTDDGSPQQRDSVTFPWTISNTNRPPTAVDVVVFAEAGVPTSLIVNGADPDGDPLTFGIATGPLQGSLTGGPRLYDYTADPAASGTDSFTFTVSDGLAVATGTVTVSITPNLAPIGRSDTYTARRGGVVSIDAPGVLGNDQDPEGRSIAAVIDSPPSHGSLTLNPDGSFIYNSRGEDVDVDRFTYRVDDGMRRSEPVTVVIVIEENLAPFAATDFVTVDEDASIVFHPLVNDSDPNNESIYVAGVVDPQHGTTEWSLDGAFIYIPDPNWNGSDTITYTISDGDLRATSVIEIVVVPINDAPVATDVEVTGHSGETLIVDLRPHVSDIDDSDLEFILETPMQGTVTQPEPGLFEIGLVGVVRDLPPLTFVVSDPSGAKDSSALTVFVRIPAELVGVPSLVGDDLGNGGSDGDGGSPPAPPEGAPVLTGLKLMVGSMFDTFQAMRVPMFVVLALALASLYLGLSNKFAFVSTPTVLPLIGRRQVDIVMALSGAGVPARTEPGSHQPVKFRFAPTERGVVTTGARSMVRSEVWVEVETPEGDGWINSEFLTEQVADSAFSDDERTQELIGTLVDRIYSSGDLLVATGGHDLHVAYYGPPTRFAASSLPRLLRGASVYWWWQPEGDTPKQQGTFDETVGESVSAAYRNRDAHLAEPAFVIPREFVNMHSLVLGNHEYGEGWRVFFRYESDEPSIAGLMREAQPNRIAMHGEMDVRSA
ncbi:MAG: DUF5011 domain-containing protein [bacterium]|nr:DUF5011 domain-containing protein [bacterium]